jgi:hypothetical protein
LPTSLPNGLVTTNEFQRRHDELKQEFSTLRQFARLALTDRGPVLARNTSTGSRRRWANRAWLESTGLAWTSHHGLLRARQVAPYGVVATIPILNRASPCLRSESPQRLVWHVLTRSRDDRGEKSRLALRQLRGEGWLRTENPEDRERCARHCEEALGVEQLRGHGTTPAGQGGGA